MIVSATIWIAVLVVIPVVAIYLVATRITGTRRWLGGAGVVVYVIAVWAGTAFLVGGAQRGDSHSPSYKLGSPPDVPRR